MTEPGPALPGVQTRQLADGDVPALLSLAEAVNAEDGGLPLASSEGFVRGRFLGETRSVAVVDGDRLVAAAAVRLTGAQFTATALVHPAARGRGIGSGLLEWALANDAARIETESLTPEAAELFASRGLTQTFAEDVMRLDLSQSYEWPPLPAGITLTAWGPEDRFFAVYEAAFRDRPGFPGWSQREWVDWHAGDEAFAPEWTMLATRADGVDVGFVACARGAWVVQVGVVPAARGGGLGAALTAEALRRMRAAGESSVLLDVHVNNPGALRVYGRLGFVHIGRRARYEREM